MDRETRKQLTWIAFLWVASTIIVEILVQVAIDNWPLIGSLEGQITGEAIFFLFRSTAPVFTLIVVILIYTIFKFRVPMEDQEPSEAQFATGWLFISGWVGLSVALNVLFIFYPGIYGLEDLWNEARAEVSANPLVINVVGKQWEWDMEYADYDLSTINEMVVPVGRPIEFVLQTDDVMHSFWVPAWGVKRSLIPGETRKIFVTPTVVTSTEEDPTLRLQCAQICGIGHPRMRGEVKVVSQEDFDKWVAKEKSERADKGGMNMNGMNMGGMNMGGMKGMSGMKGMKMDSTSDGSMKMPMKMPMNAPAQNSEQKPAQQGSDSGMKMPMGSDGTMKMPMPKAADGSMKMPMAKNPDGSMKMPMPKNADGTMKMPMPENADGSMKMPMPNATPKGN